MKRSEISTRSLFYYRRSAACTAFGCAVAAMVLTAAFIVGHSVKNTLRKAALNRLQNIHSAFITGGTGITARTAADIPDTSGMLLLEGSARNVQNELLQRVKILGVTPDFFELSEVPFPFEDIQDNEVVINTEAAERLKLSPGQELLIRIRIPGGLSPDSPLCRREDQQTSFRVTVKAVVADAQLGAFGLLPYRRKPLNIFLSRPFLCRKLEIDERCNVLLAGRLPEPGKLTEALQSKWSLRDSFLSVHPSQAGEMIESDNVFLNAFQEEAMESKGVLTWFVNSFNESPYGFASGLHPDLLPVPLKKNEILITEWLAEDLNVRQGEALTLSYSLPGSGGNLTESDHTFTVAGILPMDHPLVTEDFTPAIPGLTDAENCSEWDPVLPIDMRAIRPEDEAYWDQFRSTPKAFLSLATAQELWATPFGSLTGGVLPKGEKEAGNELRSYLRENGVGFRDIRRQALEAGQNSIDFSGLFTGLSFFIILSALMITALFFSFYIERRKQEIRLFRAMGMKQTVIQKLLLTEGGLIALCGTVIGVAAAHSFASLVLYSLKESWQQAFGGLTVTPSAQTQSFLSGFIVSWLCCTASVFFSIRGTLKNRQTASTPAAVGQSRKIRIASILILIAVLLVFLGGELMFMTAGVLLLAGTLLFASAKLIQSTTENSHFSFNEFARLQATWSLKRSLGMTVCAACGVFIIMVTCLHQRGTPDSEDPRSGTGGFDWIIETTFSLAEEELPEEGTFTRVIVAGGESADCRNLNRIPQPTLLGMDPTIFNERFTLTETTNSSLLPGELLKHDYGPDILPIFLDKNTLLWALGKKLGETIDYTSESGKPFKVLFVGTLADSIFQGKLLADKSRLRKYFPSAPFTLTLAETLSKPQVPQKTEPILTKTSDRLRDFAAVENAYLDVFKSLGAFGVVFGFIGIGAITLRNINDRAEDFALLRALGYRGKTMRKLVVKEHTLLLSIGTLCGIASGLIATLPFLAEATWRNVLISFLTSLGIWGNGIVFTMISCRIFMRRIQKRILQTE